MYQVRVRVLAAVTVVAMAIATVGAAHAQSWQNWQQDWQLKILSATVSGTTLTIRGVNLGVPVPRVNLNGMPLVVQSATSTLVVAQMPHTPLNPGTYLLTVIGRRGWDRDDDDATLLGVFDLAIGSGGSQGPAGPAGPQGAQGLFGPQGVPGAVGAAGTTGPQGSIGLPGSTGPQGSTGQTGAAGPAGLQGPTGLTGIIGPEGPQGSVGQTGAAGPAGLQGPTGLTGIIGPEGPQGVKGDAGGIGPQGTPGDAGPQGSQGPAGLPGASGQQGNVGPQGARGDVGATGSQGATGGIGAQGAVGGTGAIGPQGVKGDTGDKGVQGDVGSQGTRGDIGVTGLQGGIGPIGEVGPAGPMGPQGARGEAGDAGGSGGASRVYRWNVFDTFESVNGWLFANNPEVFGGVNPLVWTEQNGRASMISPDKDFQRSLFAQKGYPGPNALVYSDTRVQFNSIDGKVVVVLLRIRNTTPVFLPWRPQLWYSAYAPWGEVASAALNGVDVFVNGAGTSGSLAIIPMLIPPNRTSTVIFVSTSGTPTPVGGNLFLRATVLGFINRSLTLPPGLEFVDDLDTAIGGYEQ